MNERSVRVRNSEFQTDVLEGGSGDPLLFLHGVAGLADSLGAMLMDMEDFATDVVPKV